MVLRWRLTHTPYNHAPNSESRLYPCYPCNPWLKSLRREGGDDFFEAEIAPQRIPKREQLQISIGQRPWNVSSRGKLFKREILLANPRRANREPLNHQRPIECIFLRRQKLDRAATFA